MDITSQSGVRLYLPVLRALTDKRSKVDSRSSFTKGLNVDVSSQLYDRTLCSTDKKIAEGTSFNPF